MPVYNAADTVGVALQSIIDQEFHEWEAIVIDDGSTDGTFAELSRVADYYGRVRIFRNRQNAGLSRCLNQGISEARGEFIARMDADDRCSADRFSLQLLFLRNHPEIDVVGANAEIVDRNGNPLTSTSMPLTHEEIRSRIVRLNPLIHPTVMMRTGFVTAMSGYDGRLRRKQDYDLWLRGVDTHRYANIEKPLIRYRIKQADSLLSDLYGFRVRVVNAFRRKTIATGIYWAVVTLVVNLFRKVGYRQRAFRA